MKKKNPKALAGRVKRTCYFPRALNRRLALEAMRDSEVQNRHVSINDLVVYFVREGLKK